MFLPKYKILLKAWCCLLFVCVVFFLFINILGSYLVVRFSFIQSGVYGRSDEIMELFFNNGNFSFISVLTVLHEVCTVLYVIFLHHFYKVLIDILDIVDYYPNYNYDCLPERYSMLERIPITLLLFSHINKCDDYPPSSVQLKQSLRTSGNFLMELITHNGTVLWYATS